MGVNATRDKTTHNDFAEKYNPSYDLCNDRYGHHYAIFVGSPKEYNQWSIWVPKTVVSNTRGPIKKMVAKSKT